VCEIGSGRCGRCAAGVVLRGRQAAQAVRGSESAQAGAQVISCSSAAAGAGAAVQHRAVWCMRVQAAGGISAVRCSR